MRPLPPADVPAADPPSSSDQCRRAPAALVALGLAGTLVCTSALPAARAAPTEEAGSTAAGLPAAVPPVPAGLPTKVEPPADFEPQTTCDPHPKPGVVAFARLVLTTYPMTGSSGIVRSCAIGGRSEHKEGRAFDWRVSASDPGDRARARALLGWLLGKDTRGQSAAMARRLGVMYIVWNRQIWSAARAGEGWRPYAGSDGHTEHLHFSFSRAGAEGTTSYWSMPSPLAVAPLNRTVLRPGVRGPAVVVLRRALDEGDQSTYDARLRAGVVRFQNDHGLAPDGIVGPRTWQALRAALTGPSVRLAAVPDGPPLASPDAASGDPPGEPPWASRSAVRQLHRYARTPLHWGSTGPAVTAVQRVLGVQPASGYYAARTTAALRSFQRSHRLAPTGRVDAATWRTLLDALPVTKR